MPRKTKAGDRERMDRIIAGFNEAAARCRGKHAQVCVKLPALLALQ